MQRSINGIFIEKIKLYFKLNPSLEIDDTFDCHMDEKKQKVLQFFD